MIQAIEQNEWVDRRGRTEWFGQVASSFRDLPVELEANVAANEVGKCPERRRQPVLLLVQWREQRGDEVGSSIRVDSRSTRRRVGDVNSSHCCPDGDALSSETADVAERVAVRRRTWRSTQEDLQQ